MQTVLSWTILILGVALIVFILRWFVRAKPFKSRPFAIVNASRAKVEPYPYVFVKPDGSVRELHLKEREYLETPFLPADSGRPYIKYRYSQRDGWGELKGYMKRSKVPSAEKIESAPTEDPSTFLNKEGLIEFLRSKGIDVTQNIDGKISARKPK